MSLKLLIVADSFLPSLGGVERHVYTLIQYLSKQNIDIHLLTSTPSNGDQIPLNNNIKVTRTLKFQNRTQALQWPYTYIINSREVKKVIEEQAKNYDLIHYHGTHMLYINQLKIETPLITTLHGIFPSCIAFWGIENWCGNAPSELKCAQCVTKLRKSYSPLIPAMALYNSHYYNNMKKSLKKINKLIAVSDYVKNIVKDTYKLDNINTVYNFIDTKNDILHNLNKNNLKTETKKQGKTKLILFSGRIDKQKGITTLLESFKIINKTRNVILGISGNGELIENVKTMQKEFKNIILYGYLSRPEQLKLLNECDVFVAPSNYPDACPTSILEAMALGKPIVATNIGGIPELVLESENGYLVQPNKPEILAEKIIQTLDIGQEKFHDSCKERSKIFDIETQGPKIIENYREVLRKEDS